MYTGLKEAMVYWLEQWLMKQEDLGSIPAQSECFSSLLEYKEVGITWIQTHGLELILRINVDKNNNSCHLAADLCKCKV